MKNITYLLFLFLFLQGCSSNNAFSKFNLNKEQELSANSLQSSKIFYNDKIEGIITSIYLNDIYPDLYKDKEYFFIYYFAIDKDANTTITLNGELPLRFEQLSSKNQFSNLVSTHNKWNKYYLVTFEKSTDILNLLFQIENSKSSILRYTKSQE